MTLRNRRNVGFDNMPGAGFAELAEQADKRAPEYDVVVMMLQVNACHEGGSYNGEPATLRAELARFAQRLRELQHIASSTSEHLAATPLNMGPADRTLKHCSI